MGQNMPKTNSPQQGPPKVERPAPPPKPQPLQPVTITKFEFPKKETK
ncbi:MAG: hypothetical protein ACLP53_08525 [Isosphaeraceae bacterium]